MFSDESPGREEARRSGIGEGRVSAKGRQGRCLRERSGVVTSEAGSQSVETGRGSERRGEAGRRERTRLVSHSFRLIEA